MRTAKLFSVLVSASAICFSVACSDPAQAPPASSGPQADSAKGAARSDSAGGVDQTPGGQSVIGSSPDNAWRVAFQAPQAGVTPWPGRAQIVIYEAHLQNGYAYPEYAELSAGGESGEGASLYGAAFALSVSGDDLLATRSFSAPTGRPGVGDVPTGAAYAGMVLPVGAALHVLPDGRVELFRGDGTLSGSIITNTPAGTISFSGRYEISCFAVAATAPAPEGAIGLDPSSLVHDPEFASAFCQRFAALRGPGL